MISDWLVFLTGMMLLSSILMITQSYVTSIIKLLVLQNMLLATYLLVTAIDQPNGAVLISLVITVLIKVIALPFLLWKLTRFLQLVGRVELVVNKSTLLLLATILILFALMLGRQAATVMPQVAVAGFSLGLANAFVAILLVIFRRKTVSQVVGLLVLENSIFILPVTLSTGLPWLVELGMSFDVLMGFMIFTLFLLRIRKEYGSLQMQHIEKLRERA